MEKEEYKKLIREMIDKAEDEELLRRIYLIITVTLRG